jgi:hypothetical protein
MRRWLLGDFLVDINLGFDELAMRSPCDLRGGYRPL